ncbi:DUF202 domain-containing protein [Streptomyces kunmingensis]|uniref:DUF202 domain-containing protein n=1 Tax=Streptomyces kunmingensis TaxID=68225 RepID=A0ABU6CB41_9ACTN|nr:DUF202 domain-containing protein [Streptomyces kunmingensis]MEB3961928.1 DUF202 domain-containing protein [Streptomyces kunmingensis]
MSGPEAGGADASGPVRDPGLQPARTRLAWRRTTLSCTVAAVLAVKTVLHGGIGPVGIVAAALCLGVWLGFLGIAHHRITGLARNEAAPPRMSRRAATTAALCTVALAVFAAALVV